MRRLPSMLSHYDVTSYLQHSSLNTNQTKLMQHIHVIAAFSFRSLLEMCA